MPAQAEEYIFESLVESREPPQDTNLARELLDSFRRHSDRPLIVDALSGRHWTGSQILAHCGRIAACLLERARLNVNDVVMTILDRNDSELLVALGILLAGGAIYPTTPTDGYNEAAMLCELVQPQVIMINRRYQAMAERLCREVAGMSETRIVWVEGFGASRSHIVHTNVQAEREPDENNNNCPLEQPKGSPLNGRPAFEIRLADLVQAQGLDEQQVESVVREKIRSHVHIASYLLTSGSTGRPKVVPATHAESVASLYCMISAATNPLPAAKEVASPFQADNIDNNNNDDNNNNNNNNNHHAENQTKPEDDLLLPIGPNDVLAGDLPLDHGAGLNVMFLSLWLGSKYIVMPSFDARLFWRSVSDFKITFSLASTAFCFQLFTQLKSQLKTGAAGDSNNNDAADDDVGSAKLDLSSLRTISCCGAKLNFVELVEEIRMHYKHMSVNQSYGCTENGYISNLAKRDLPKHIDSVGYLLPGIKAKIVEPGANNKTLGPNQPGELLIWSKSLFQNYRCHREVDAGEILRNCRDERGHYYRTGDQAHFDSAGRLHLHGRYKDTLVLYGDWKIMPAELEQVVDAHPLVELSTVVGVPDPELPSCHKPRAFVKLIRLAEGSGGRQAQAQKVGAELAARLAADDREFIAEHIRQFVADRVAPAKKLTGGVRILDEFPRNGLLRKIDRKALREMA